MELRPLGSTGLQVSPIGLGTTKLGRNQGVKYPEPFALPSDARARELLEAARANGINLIDTAPAYGSSEARLGQLLDRREDWVIVSKAGESFRDGQSAFDFSREGVERSVRESLARLRTAWIDVVLLHSNGEDLDVLESGGLEALRSLRDAGLVRAIGASTKTVAGGLRAVACCDVVMVSLSRDDRSQLPVVEAARKAGVGVLVKKPLASGHDTRPGQALAEVLSVPGVSSVVVGTIDPAHLAANCQAVSQALDSGARGCRHGDRP